MRTAKYLSVSKRTVFVSVFCPGARGVNTAVEPTRGGEKGKDVLYMVSILLSIGPKQKAGSI